MPQLLPHQQTSERIFYLLGLLLLFPALFINLGLMPVLADEPTRGIVSMEMIFRNNYLVSTMNGEFYYNKPPLYNALLAGFFNLSGNYSEFTLRLPSVLSLLLFGLSVFFITGKQYGHKIGFIAAFAVMTSGRILFYDSLLGLIDIMFSWLIYLSFMALYHYHRKQKLLWLFTITYFITAITFLMKGLPSIVFQGISMLAVFIYHKQFKKLFSWQHFVGLGVFIAIIGAYFLWYNQYNSLENYFNTLWSESSKRTALETGWGAAALHFISFPFEYLFNAAPWSILLLCCFNKGFKQKLKADGFLRFNLLIFLANIPIYWLSPETVPRYLFMFFPLLIVIGVYAYQEYQASQSLTVRIVEWGFLLFGIAAAGFMVVPLFNEVLQDLPFLYIKSLGLLLAFIVLIVAFYRLRAQRILVYISILLCTRVAFNLFVLPERHIVSPEEQYRIDGTKIGQLTKGEPLHLFEYSPINHDIAFYIEREREAVLTKDFDTKEKGSYYIVSDYYLNHILADINYTKYYSFETYFERTQLHLVRLEEELPE